MTMLKGAFRALAALMAGWLLWRVFGPEVPRRYPTPQRRPIRIPGRSVFVGEREFFVRETGPSDAPTVVLIHGWSLDGEMTYFPLVPGLAEHCRVVIPDLRNHGRSDWIRGKVDVEQLAEEVAAVLDALDVHKATIMGYSLGGMVTQELSKRHPHVLRHMVLACTAAATMPRGRILAGLAFGLGRAVARISTKEAAMITTRALVESGGLDPGNERYMYEALRRRDGTLFYESGFAAVRFDSRSWIGKLDVPATVVVATRDMIVPTNRQRELAALLPEAELVVLEGVGHESLFTCTDTYVDLLVRLSKEV